MKPFMKSEYSVIQSSAMTDQYKWVIADVLSVKKAIFSEVNPSYSKLCSDREILFDIISV